jgi:hypothetical protein
MQVLRHASGHASPFALPGVRACIAATLMLAVVGCRSAPGERENDVVSGASQAGSGSPAVTQDAAPVDDGPRTLVVYFSQGISTRCVAEDIAVLLRADIERIVERRPRKWGFFGFMAAGAASSFGRATPIQPAARDPGAYQAVVVCTPVWAWHMAPPTRSWLRANRGKLPALSAYVTVSGDTDPAKVVAAMAKESGRQPIASAGFADRDFEPGNRALYLGKIGGIVERFIRY